MKALSIQQPWAHLIAAGLKDIENRTWPTGHRGPISIHASKLADRHATLPTEEAAALIAADQRTIAFGRIIAVADLVDCHTCDGRCSPWAIRGQWHWKLANVRALAAPILARGSLGLWNVPDHAEADLQGQLAEVAQ